MSSLPSNQLVRTTASKPILLPKHSIKSHTSGKPSTATTPSIYKLIIISKALNSPTSEQSITPWLYLLLTPPSDMLDVQAHKTKTIMNHTNLCGLCSDKVHSKDVWSVVKSSSLSDSEINFPAKWITTCQTSTNCGFKIWVRVIQLITSQLQRPTLTFNTHCLSNLKTLLLS